MNTPHEDKQTKAACDSQAVPKNEFMFRLFRDHLASIGLIKRDKAHSEPDGFRSKLNRMFAHHIDRIARERKGNDDRF